MSALLAILMLQAAGATPPPATNTILWVWYQTPGAAWVYGPVSLDSALVFSVDAPTSPGIVTGGKGHLSTYVATGPAGPQGPPGKDATYAFGNGLVPVALAPFPTQVGIDTSFVTYRTAVPKGPGPCGPSVPIEGGVSLQTGTGAIAADATGLYICTQTTPGSAGVAPLWLWTRYQGATAW